MTTRMISIREFRDNMPKLLKEAQKKDIHFVVMRHSEPVANITPIKKKKKYGMDDLLEDVRIAREQLKRGEVYTSEEVEKILGL